VLSVLFCTCVPFIFYTSEVNRVLSHTMKCIYGLQDPTCQVRLVRVFRLQIDLSESFKVVISCNIVRVSKLQVDTAYPVVSAQNVEQNMGPPLY
jgi:hypothetical protein